MFKQKNKKYYYIIFFVIFFILLTSVILLFTHSQQTSGQQQSLLQKSQSGIALSFDDKDVDQWFEIRDLLKKYHANVTFFVSNFETLTGSQIDKLKVLQADGHEIAFHGMYHTDAAEYIKNHSIQEYLNYEIIPGIDLMKNEGFDPVDFAYPFGSESSSLTIPLHQYFLHVRGIAKITDSNLIYYQYGANRTHINGAEIDEVSNAPLKDITGAILKAKEENTILILYAHKPVKTNPVEYEITYDKIEKILIDVSDNNMKFYKISEIN